MDLFEMIKGHLGQAGPKPADGEAAPAASAGVPTGLIGAVLAMLKEHGLGNFIEFLRSKGLGNLVQSWVGTGPNDPVTGEQLASALKPEQIEKLSEASGVPASEVPAMLSQVLPSLIDKLSPNGKVEEGSMLDQALDFVKGRLEMPTS
jgi:uncharacterized protein YidB (DUF937 family)